MPFPEEAIFDNEDEAEEWAIAYREQIWRPSSLTPFRPLKMKLNQYVTMQTDAELVFSRTTRNHRHTATRSCNHKGDTEGYLRLD